MSNTVVVFQSENGLSRGSPESAGVDLRCMNAFSLMPGERKMIDTGVHLVECSEDYYVQLAPRSGLALKFGIQVLAGVIDRDYRGEIKAILLNSGNEPFHAKAGDRICQAITIRCATGNSVLEFIEDGLYGEIGSSLATREGNGFGSSGN